jgi:hypothetical protein
MDFLSRSDAESLRLAIAAVPPPLGRVTQDGLVAVAENQIHGPQSMSGAFWGSRTALWSDSILRYHDAAWPADVDRARRPRKMTLHQRQEVLQRLHAGETMADVARTYNIDATTIGRLAAASPFAHVPADL